MQCTLSTTSELPTLPTPPSPPPTGLAGHSRSIYIDNLTITSELQQLSPGEKYTYK